MRLSKTAPLALLTTLASADPTLPLPVSASATASPYLDPSIWSPITTIINPSPLPTPNPAPTSTSITPTPLFSKLSSYILHDLLRRSPQVPGQVLSPTTTQLAQVPPVTTAEVFTYKDGAPIAYTIVYTQLFTTPLDQWPGPGAGEIGLGTIQGTIGVVKTKIKRDVAVQTQVPVNVLSGESLAALADIETEKEVDVVEVEGILLSPEIASSLTEEKAATSEFDCKHSLTALENKTGKVRLVDSSAGSALALVLAIAVMIIA